MDIGFYEVILGAKLAKSIIFELIAEYRQGKSEPMTREEYLEIAPVIDKDLENAMSRIRAH